jgi:predicted enzyme related to lactoylglutathione lyase
MANPVVHWEILGKDGAKLQAFYAGLFDWKVDANNPMGYGMVDMGGAGMNGGIFGAMEDQPSVKIYVQVDDLQAALDKAGRLGGKTVMPPTDVPGGPSIAQFADPDGNVIGLTKQ